jgi:hypothetical protein
VPTTSGPFSPAAGVTFPANNPSQGSGNAPSASAVIVNISPFELVVSSGAGAVVGLVDPFTRNIVLLDDEAGQQLTIDPLAIGLSNLGVTNQVYIQWFGPSETVPGVYPSAIGGMPVDTTLGQATVAFAGTIGPGVTATPFFNISTGIYRSCRIYLNNSQSSPKVWAAVALAGIYPAGGTTPTYVFETVNVLCPGLFGEGQTGMVFPLASFGPNGGIGTGLKIQNLDATQTLECMVLLDPAPAERSVPFPWYEGGEVPGGASLAASLTTVAGVNALLAAPTNTFNAYYLFGFDLVTGGAGTTATLLVGGVAVGEAYNGAANAIADHPKLDRIRAAAAVTVNSSAAGAVTLRFAYGP